MDETKNKRFYVYVLLDPRPLVATPFYVGKGSGYRMSSHLKLSSKENQKRNYKNSIIKSIRNAGLEPIAVRYIENLNSVEALRIERDLISRFGRRDLNEGILGNLTDGGDGPQRFSELTRAKMSERMKGDKNPVFGGHLETTKKLMAEKALKRCAEGRGSRHTQEFKQLLAARNTELSSKKVIKYDLNGSFVEVFNSMISLADNIGMNKGNCAFYVVKDGSLPLDGFFYRYYNSIEIKSGFLNRENLIEQRRNTRIIDNRAKKIGQYSTSGQLMNIFKSIGDAVKSDKMITRSKLNTSLKNGNIYHNSLWVRISD